MRWLALTSLLLCVGCESALKGAGEQCFGTSECSAGLTCDFGQTPPVCAEGQSGDDPVVDAAVSDDDGAVEPTEDAAPGTPDAATEPDAAPEPDAMPDAAPMPDATPDAGADAA